MLHLFREQELVEKARRRNALAELIDHEVASFLNIIDDPHRFIKFGQLLGKEAEADGLSNGKGAFRRDQLTGQYFEQCRLTDTVGADDTDAVVFHDVIVYVSEQGLCRIVAKSHVIDIEDGFSQPGRRIEELDFADRLAVFNGTELFVPFFSGLLLRRPGLAPRWIQAFPGG